MNVFTRLERIGGIFGMIVFIMLGSVGPGGLVFARGSETPQEAETVTTDQVFPRAAAKGFTVGGFKDIGAFRAEVRKGNLPLTESLTYEGLFNEYGFDLGTNPHCRSLFCPSFKTAISRNPFTDEMEYYLAIGLGPGPRTRELERRKLNLVVALDISGSMSSPLDAYYYSEGQGNGVSGGAGNNASKLDAAMQAVAAIVENLRPYDRFGLVLFDSQAYTAEEMLPAPELDVKTMFKRVRSARSWGRSNILQGTSRGMKLFEPYMDDDRAEFENRLVIFSDFMPNDGDVEGTRLRTLIREAADEKVHTTCIGVGTDWNCGLIPEIGKISGANAYTLENAGYFVKRIHAEFSAMVSPYVFDLTITMKSLGFEIDEVYGTPDVDVSTGDTLRINTLFYDPKSLQRGPIRGGVVLLKLKRREREGSVYFEVGYTDRFGTAEAERHKAEFTSTSSERYGAPDIFKAVVLTRYLTIVKSLVEFDRKTLPEQSELPLPPMSSSKGLSDKGQNAAQNVSLRRPVEMKVDANFRTILRSLERYVTNSAELIGDQAMQREVEMIRKLLESARR